MDSSQTNNISSLSNTLSGSGSDLNDPDIILLNQYFSQSDWIENESEVSNLIPEWKISPDGKSMIQDRNVFYNHKKLLMIGRQQMFKIKKENSEVYNALIEKFEKDKVAPTKELYLLFSDVAKKNKGKVIFEENAGVQNRKMSSAELEAKYAAYRKTYENMEDDPTFKDLKNLLKSQSNETIAKVYKFLKSDTYWNFETIKKYNERDKSLHIRNSLYFWESRDTMTYYGKDSWGRSIKENWNEMDWGNEDWVARKDDTLESYLDRVMNHFGISWDENGNIAEEKVDKQAVINKKNADYLRTSWTPLEEFNYMSRKIQEMRNRGELIPSGMYTQLGIVRNRRSNQIREWSKQGRLPGSFEDMGKYLRQADEQYSRSVGRPYLGPKGDPVHSSNLTRTSNTSSTRNTYPTPTYASSGLPRIIPNRSSLITGRAQETRYIGNDNRTYTQRTLVNGLYYYRTGPNSDWYRLDTLR